MLTSPEEARQRAVVFRDKIRPYVEDAPTLWNRAKYDLLETYETLKRNHGLRHMSPSRGSATSSSWSSWKTTKW